MTKANKWKGHCACGANQYESTEEPSLFLLSMQTVPESNGKRARCFIRGF